MISSKQFVLLFSLLMVSLLFLPSAAAYTPPASNRTKYNFNYDWKFLKADPGAAEGAGYDDSAWTAVSCPHTFNDIDTFDDYMVGNHVGEANQWRGTVWYRKHFKLPAADSGKKVFIEFEAVRQIADVYVNGAYLGKNSSGFTPFGYDLTPYLNFGTAENVVAVKANNERSDLFNDNNPIPWNHEHWHPTHGGIYRNVYLHVMDKLHVTLPLYDNLQTKGTYVYASNVSSASAEVTIEAQVKNDESITRLISWEGVIVDNDGNVVQTVTASQNIAAGAVYNFKGTATVLNPKLWLTRHPYLYSVYTIVKIGSVVKDVYRTPLGVRSFDFNKDSGFWLNGEHVKLHGWGQKPTGGWAGLGAAQPDWLRDFTYRLMDEAGGNFIRWGHCAGSPAEIAMGDRYGFVTLMPGVCGEGDGEGAWDIRSNAFRDMIVYFRNNPSIFIWEGGNWGASESHFVDLTASINTFDPHGLRLLGNRRADVKKAAADNHVTIEVGTEGWDREFPNLPIVESEYCRDESPRRVWDNDSLPSYGDYPRKSMNQYKWTSEQYAVLQADHWWNKMGKKPYHCGGANWIFSDGTHGGRNPSEVVRASGEVDAVHLPKEAFYALKSMWRPEAQVHIVGHWTYEAGRKKDVYVMSNCSKVKLYVNGVLKGENVTPENGYAFKFPAINFAPGTIKAEGYIDDVLRASQQKETAEPKQRIRLTPITGPKGWRADGSDIALLDVEVVDANGKRCPTNQQDITFTVSGPGIWCGGYNSNSPANTRALTLYTECGINRVAIRSTRTPGIVTVTANGAGVLAHTVQITSGSVAITDGLTTELPQVYNDPLGPPEPLPVPISGSTAINGLSATVIAFSSEQSTSPAAGITDGNLATRWAASAAGLPQWVEMDLGAIKLIDRATLSPYLSRTYQYKIETKTTAGGSYALALDETAATTGGSSITKTFPAVSARYVKLTITGGIESTWATLWEFQIFEATAPPLTSELFTNFSYTGVGQAVLGKGLGNGELVYSDRALTYANLPPYLSGSEFIKTPDADKIYWALDQLQFLPQQDLEVYVAHDDRVPRPAFITSGYIDTGDDILIQDSLHSIFKRRVGAGTGVVMAGNFDSGPDSNSNMYVVFVKAAVAVIPPETGTIGTIYGDLADASPLSTLGMGSTRTDLSFYAGQDNNVHRSPVFVFQLPNRGELAAPFAKATLSFHLDRRDVNAAVGNVDLYGLGKRDTSTVAPGDYWGDTSATDNADAAFLQNDILIPTSATDLVYTSGDVSSYLNAQYANGTGISKYVFLRLSTDADFGNSQRYFITSSDGAAIANAGAPNLTIWPKLDFTFLPDADNDGLPDSWEVQYFNSLTKTARGDEDGDGQSNLMEFIAGTIPNDANSLFRIKAPIAGPDGGFGLRWDSVVGRIYTVMKSDTLVGDWSAVSTPMQGTGGELTFTAPVDAGSRWFYKIQAIRL